MRDLEDGIALIDGGKVTLNQMFERYIAGKSELKASTRTNYLYMYRHFVEGELGRQKLSSIKYSDVKQFYDYLIGERGMQPNSVELIHTILHPIFTMAVRDEYLRTNPTDGVMGEIKKKYQETLQKLYKLVIKESITR